MQRKQVLHSRAAIPRHRLCEQRETCLALPTLYLHAALQHTPHPYKPCDAMLTGQTHALLSEPLCIIEVTAPQLDPRRIDKSQDKRERMTEFPGPVKSVPHAGTRLVRPAR